MKFNVLDHGYVELIEPWGTGRQGRLNQDGFPNVRTWEFDYEVGLIEAARQSTQGNFRGWDPQPCSCSKGRVVSDDPREHEETCGTRINPGDRRLLSFLYNNNHATPFEFAGMVIEVQAPLFVFREWQRHRTQGYNEMSARYTALPDLYYQVEAAEVIRRSKEATSNKQAGTMAPCDEAAITEWTREDLELAAVLEKHYQRGLSIGVPKELARKKMPVDHYSRMRATANLRNWLAFMTLRCDPKAQYEIRMYANVVAGIISAVFPNTYQLWAKGFASARV